MKKIWLLKVFGICLCVCIGLFLFTPYLQAATPTYIQLEFSDIDYDEAQYIKFIIDADEDFDIVLYMKDNDNNTFRVWYQTENNEDTGDYKDDNDDNDGLAIFLDEDEYVTGHDETFNSFTHGNSFSLDEYINTHWQKREYNGDSAKLEKIRIQGNEFKLYYIAIDDGDFSDPTWELDVSDENWDDLDDFENDGHSIPDLDEYSTYTTDITFQGDYIHLTIDYLPGVGYLPSPYWWNQPYNYGWNQPYSGGYQQPYNPYRYQQSYFQTPFYGNDFGPSPFGYQQPQYGYYQPTTFANDMVGNGYPTFNNPYGVGYQQPYNPSYSSGQYWAPSLNSWMVPGYPGNEYKQIYGNSLYNPYPSPYGPSGMGILYTGFPPPTIGEPCRF